MTQKEIICNLFEFDYLVITNNGLPLLEIKINNSEHLSFITSKIKMKFNLSLIVYLKINGISNKNYYFVVDPIGKHCYSYVFEYMMENLDEINSYGLDIKYWKNILKKKNITLFDIFKYYFPVMTNWNIISKIIKCNIDWNPKVFKQIPEKLTSFFDKINYLIGLLRKKYKTKI